MAAAVVATNVRPGDRWKPLMSRAPDLITQQAEIATGLEFLETLASAAL